MINVPCLCPKKKRTEVMHVKVQYLEMSPHLGSPAAVAVAVAAALSAA